MIHHMRSIVFVLEPPGADGARFGKSQCKGNEGVVAWDAFCIVRGQQGFPDRGQGFRGAPPLFIAPRVVAAGRAEALATSRTVEERNCTSVHVLYLHGIGRTVFLYNHVQQYAVSDASFLAHHHQYRYLVI